MHFDNFNLHCVALRKESVDRNCEGVFLLRKITMSLSARRAWIEIWHKMSSITAPAGVALRKESVDRNKSSTTSQVTVLPSLSARRAWIEMGVLCLLCVLLLVALRKESVDRNAHFMLNA